MKLLRNRKTKALFPYSESLLKLNHNMEIYDTALDKPAIEDMGVVDLQAPQAGVSQQELESELEAESAPQTDATGIMIGDKSIHDAEKKDLIEYMSIAFNETMPARSTKQELIDKIIELSA